MKRSIKQRAYYTAEWLVWMTVGAIGNLDRMRRRIAALEDAVRGYQLRYPASVKQVVFAARQAAAIKGPLPMEADERIRDITAALEKWDRETAQLTKDNVDGFLTLRGSDGEEIKP